MEPSKPAKRIIYFYDVPSERVKAENTYLNNYEITPFIIGPDNYKSVEHYFQSEKYRRYNPEQGGEDGEKIRQAVIATETADESKKLARKYQEEDKRLKVNVKHWQWWEEAKNDVMRQGIKHKFEQHPDLMKKLMETGDAILVEDSPVDMYWGGWLEGSKNTLGNLLMEFRDSQKPKL